MENKINTLLENLRTYNQKSSGKIQILTDEPMMRHTTFRIGGPADLYLEPTSEEDLRYILKYAKETDVRTIVIGRGSNLLFDDAGFRGAVIATSAMRSIEINGTVLRADAGAALRSAANAALENSLTGFEFAHGIPASCGGAVFMNAGAYDGEISQILVRSRYYDCAKDSFDEIENSAHEFAYRESIYRSHPEWVILSAEFCLRKGSCDEIRAKMDDLMRRRADKQPLEYPSAGSTFKRYPGRFTAQMIDEAGLKGYTVGGAQVSEKHAGFIINRGDATAADVRSLIEYIRAELQKKYGVLIETEVIAVSEK